MLPVWEIPRLWSAILIDWGTFAIVWRDLQTRFEKPKAVWHVGQGCFLALWLLAAYYLGLYVALVFAWEYVADPTVVEALATGRNAFEVTFVVVQFLYCLAMVVGTAWAAWLWQKREKTVPMVSSSKSPTRDSPFRN